MLQLPKKRKQSNKIPTTDQPKASWLNRLSRGLKKTQHQLTAGLARLIFGKKTIDAQLLAEIETALLNADVGVTATQQIIETLTTQISRKQLVDTEGLWQALQYQLQILLQPCEQRLSIECLNKPYVILVVGVNGVGKTTTIGKLSYHLQQQGNKVMLAAGDTFRAAATEQLKVWANLNQIPLIAQHQGADSASVIFDALQAAKARNADVLIADTAGRLHTKDHLMQELQKIKRVLQKLDPDTPQEILLVLDAGNGQNSIIQAEQFQQAIAITGVVLTKLDGTAKGGVIFTVATKLGLPIRFIGVGENRDDLQIFSATEFVSALFADNQSLR